MTRSNAQRFKFNQETPNRWSLYKNLLPEFVHNPPALYDKWDGRLFSKKLALWAGFSLIVNVTADILLVRALPLIGWPVYLMSIAVFLFCTTALLNFVYSNLWGRYRVSKRMASALELPGKERILDLDVGEGVFAAAFAEKLAHSGKVYGLGRWRENRSGREALLKLMRQLQEKKVHQTIRLGAASLFQIPFEKDYFDLVFFKQSETAVIPKAKLKDFLEELLRVLKPQGEFVILTAKHFTEMRATLKELGVKKCRYSKRLFELFPLYRLLRGKKPIE